MEISFDLAKDAANRAKHGVSLGEAAYLEWEAAIVHEDTRHDYGESRFRALVPMKGRLYCAVFVDRPQQGRRIISLRKANLREFRAYEKITETDSSNT